MSDKQEQSLEDEPASKEMEIAGSKYDINNMPGVVRNRLIMEGEVTADDFITPPNMPGAKLKALRDEHRSRVEASIRGMEGNKKNTYEVGDIVIYKNIQTEVLEIDDNKLVIMNDKGKKVKVSFTKVTPLESTESEE